MMCAWESLLGILPQWMVTDVDRIGRYALQELRLRLHSPPELVMQGGSQWMAQPCEKQDIAFVIQAASRYSPWAARSVNQGFLTAPGGHRIGLCGLALYRGGQMSGIREITSLCIRVARDYPGIAEKIPREGSVLILGVPGWGKTTLLRDLIRQRSRTQAVAVVDERGELFPEGFDTGMRTDILRGCRKPQGIDQVLRTMGPGCIALDEITAQDDCEGVIRASGCGTTLLATAHAGSKEEFLARPVYRPLAEKGVFRWMAVLGPDKGYRLERMEP